MFYYVIQEVGGSLYAHGPYMSEDARDNRADNISGGEVHKFNSFQSDPDAAIQEYRDEAVKLV